MQKKLVIIILFSLVLGVLGWDAWLYADQVEGNSISQIIAALSLRYPLIPWFIGCVMGFLGAHFFDTSSQQKRSK